MRRAVQVLAALAALAVALVVGFVSVQYWRVSHPRVEHNALPASLVALDSPEGQALLAGASARADADALLAAYQPQLQQHWAGVATTTTVMSALRGDQRTQWEF